MLPLLAAESHNPASEESRNPASEETLGNSPADILLDPKILDLQILGRQILAAHMAYAFAVEAYMLPLRRHRHRHHQKAFAGTAAAAFLQMEPADKACHMAAFAGLRILGPQILDLRTLVRIQCLA
jgi:hypothetical protein